MDVEGGRCSTLMDGNLLASIKASPEKAGWFEFPGFAEIPDGYLRLVKDILAMMKANAARKPTCLDISQTL